MQKFATVKMYALWDVSMLIFMYLSCSDFGIFKPADVYGPEDAEISVTSELDVGIVCEGAPTQIEVSNTGVYPLTIEDITISGNGWLIDTFSENGWSTSPLPLKLEPDETTTIPLLSGEGSGELRIDSSDVNTPTSTISLYSIANEAPTIEILSPQNGDVLPRTSQFFEGRIQDDRDLPGELLMQWRSSVDGVFGNTNASDDGLTQAEWLAGHSAGNHIIQLMATDICGETADAQIQVCQESGFSEESMWSGDWSEQGGGQWSESDENVKIVYTEDQTVGSIFAMHETLSASQISMSFRFSLEGFGHEGFALVALDDSAEGNAEGNTIASGGGCLGYGDHMECGSEGHTPLLGWMVEFDTNVNAWDPAEGNHVAFVLQGEQDSHIFWTDIGEIQDNGWHEVNVSVLDGIFQIELDGVLLIEEILMDNQDVAQHWENGLSFPAYIGFTGSGSAGTQLVVDDLYVIEPTCSLESSSIR